MSRPLIGLTTTLRPDLAGTMLAGIRQTYVQAILDAGGLPVLVPAGPADILRATLQRLDGLLLPGGGDIAPTRFGEQPHARLGGIEPERDDLEIHLCQWALEGGKPVLGICRGIQVMNVAAGGTLYQDIPSQYTTTIRHPSDLAQPRGFLAHDVIVQPGTRLAGLVGAGPLPVNSWHHQAAKDVGRGLVVTARSADGIIEAMEAPEHPFAVAVQFHPEDLYTADERIRRLFAGFVEACASEAP
jgi:putative glutamine amidotransferase